VEERDNRWKIDNKLKETLDSRKAIPFLRTNDPEYKEIIKTKGKFMILDNFFFFSFWQLVWLPHKVEQHFQNQEWHYH
jgi:hypothetical protein